MPEQVGGLKAKRTGARALTCSAVAALALFSGDALTAKAPKPGSDLDTFYLHYRPSVRFMFGFSQCMVRRDPQQSMAALLAPYGSQEQVNATGALIDKSVGCMDNMNLVKAQIFFFMGAMAEQLMRLEGAEALRPIGSPQDFSGGGGSFVWRDKRLKPADLADLSHITACLVYSDPNGVAALLATSGATDGERRQFNAMVPQIKACVPANRSMSFEPIALRAGLAYAWYVAPRWKNGITVAWLDGGR